jgi:hypothetical protein
MRITAQQLNGWEKAGLIRASDTYSFVELLQLKKVRDLRAKKVRSAVIKESLDAMLKQVSGMENPLLEASAFSMSTRRIVFRHKGTAVEPIAGQYVMDFAPEQRVVATNAPTKVRELPTAETVGELFARGVSLEDDPASHAEAIECYRRVLQMEPAHAAAHINLGTLFYNRQDHNLAEKH